MKSVILAAAALLVSSQALAVEADWLRCQDFDSPDYAMVIFGEQSAFVVRDGETTHMNCREVPPTPPGGFDMPVTFYACIEDRAGEGRLGLTLTSGGLWPRTEAHVTREQMFPLAPLALDSYLCEGTR